VPRYCIGLLFLISLSAACETDAVGVADCRAIEDARCQAAAPCGFPDVEECQRYARDHCLHGLPAEAPSPTDVDACVQDLATAGECAGSLGPDTLPDACAPPLSTDGSAASICDVINRPERATACAFLLGTTDEDAEGS